MKKAFDALQAKGNDYEFHDYKKQGIDADTLAVWLKKIVDKVLNKKGTTWRKLTADEQATLPGNEQNLIETLMASAKPNQTPCITNTTRFCDWFTRRAMRHYQPKLNIDKKTEL